MKTLTRRNFLKYCGVGAASLAALSLAACNSSKEEGKTNTGTGASTNTNTNTNSSTNSNSGGLIQQGDVGGQGTKLDVTDEVKAATGQIEKMGYGFASASFNLTCFSSPAGGREGILSMIWPRLIYLTSYGGTLEESEMWLAKSVTKVDDVTYDVELYDYIVDSQGNPIKADDVIWSYEQATTVGEMTEVGGVTKSVEKIDDTHLRFTLTGKGAGKVEVMLGFHRMTICNKAWHEGASDEGRRVNTATAAAYYVKEFVTGSKVVIEAVDNYWQTDEALKGVAGQQNVKTIYCPIITEKPVRAAALQNGEIDYGTVDISARENFVNADGSNKEGFRVMTTGGATCLDLFMNMDTESDSVVANNLPLRQAMLYAIDRESCLLAAGFDLNSGWVCYDIGTPLMAGFQEEWKETWFPYDPDKAKALMKEAGLEKGVKVRFHYTASFNAGMVAVVTECLAAIGVEVEPLAYDQALYNTYKYDSSIWDIELDNKGGYSLIDDLFNLFWPAGYTNGGCCFCKDQHFYDLIEKAAETGDQADLNALHDYMQEIAIGTGLYSGATIQVVQDGIIKVIWNNYMQPMINAWTFAEDFTSNVITD